MKNSNSNVLVVIEQKGSDEIECRQRFLAGCEYFNAVADNTKNNHLMIVGGANNGVRPATIRSWCPESLLPFLTIDNEAGNTREKAESIFTFVGKHQITRVVQVTSLYHSLRAFLTTYKDIRENFPAVTFQNVVCDSSTADSIRFAIMDEILLAISINPEVNFSFTKDDYESYAHSANGLVIDEGILKHLLKRHGEASRVINYSELGKNHLTTTINTSAVLKSYIL